MSVDQDKLLEYLLGNCNEKDNKMIENKLKEDAQLRKEYDELAKIWSEFNDAPLVSPSNDVQERFDKWLAEEVKKPQRTKVLKLTLLKYAAAVAVTAIIAVALLQHGQTLSTKSTQLNNTSSDLVWASATSTTERIKGIYQHTEDDTVNPELISLLVKLLKEDESPNVRLTALEALQTFPMSDEIKAGMMTALETEEKPVVQIAIITALVGLQQSDAKPHLEALINDAEIESSVKDEAQLGLLRL